MGIKFLFIALVFGAVTHGEEMEFIEGLSADEIMNGEFPVEYAADDDRTIDEIIAAAGTLEGAEKAAGANQQVNFDMDMQMEPLQYATEYGDMQGFAGAGMENSWYRWPKGIIPYKIQSGFSSSQINTIYAGMQMWMRKTCIRFVPAGSSDAKSAGHNHHIEIFSGGGCYSSVGYNHRSHQVSLQRGGCTYKGIVAHELGHTIGLHHEQCRPDRDRFVKILLDNVPSKMRYNFNLVRGTNNFGQSYDYCSLMHYGRTAFGGRKFTIVPRDLDYLGTIGKSHTDADLTQSDAAIVNTMYKCGMSSAPTACGKTPCSKLYSSSTCNSLSNMLGGGRGNGGNNGNGDNGGAGSNCVNKNSNCQGWADSGECDKNPNWMIPNCPMACGLCENCGNQNSRCQEWADRGECDRNPWYMLTKCNKACKLC